jgi:transposase
LVPPNDDPLAHACPWRDYALHLAEKIASVESKIAVLERAAFGRKSEKTGKMPPVARPPKSKDETAERRNELALLRAERTETVDTTTPVPEEDKTCHLCGGTTFRNVGPGKTCEVWEYVPGYFRRNRLHRETVACRCGGCVLTAPAPPRWAKNTRYASSFVAYLIVSKCLVVTPHYRLEQLFARTGVPMARSTMNELFHRAAQKLERLQTPLFDAIRSNYLVHADETSFKLTTQTSKAFMWTFVGEELTGYYFALNRSGEVPITVLGDSAGALVCDDYRGYDPLERKCKRTRCGCLAHVRRKFFEAGDVPQAKEALVLISFLYAVEHEAERRGVLGTAEHLALRQRFSQQAFHRLMSLARALRRSESPRTLLGRAASYAWKNFGDLRRFLGDVRLPLDNNLAERAMRIVALGRKNFMFVHSEEAGKNLALLYSLVISCTRVEVNPIAYLTDVLDRIDKVPDHQLADLLPHRWKPPPKSVPPTDFDG